jgi:DNA-binding NarL/FixJ family response regulator
MARLQNNGQDSSTTAGRKNTNPRGGRISHASPWPYRLPQCPARDGCLRRSRQYPNALIKIAECKPQLLVIGLRLGAGDTVEFIKALKVQTPGLLILVYSGFEESIFAIRALRAGADGYLMKRSARDEMVAAISDILHGEIYVSRELALRVFKEALDTQPVYRLPGRATPVENLSDR